MKAKLAACFLVSFLLFGVLPVHALEKDGRSWQDETVYFLMVDRFNNGSQKNDKKVDANDPLAYNGGDFQGIIDKLDHIKDMGFSAIMLTPVFDNVDGGYHGYWVNDFYKTEEHFGTMKEFKALVKKAHDEGLKVLIDFPANNVGPASKLLTEKGPEWFHEKNTAGAGSDRDAQLNGWVDELPDFNHENPEVRAYLIDAAKWWIKETNIDGYRLDSANHVPAEFWTEFSKAVKAQKSGFHLIGDLGRESESLYDEYKNAGFDSINDYPLMEELRSGLVKPDRSMSGILDRWGKNKGVAPNPYEMAVFFDDQKLPRFTRDMVNVKQFPGSQWKQALTFMYTTPGIPVVYYGTEIAVDGGEPPDNSRLMNFRTEKELIDHIGKLSKLRKMLPSLTRGTMETLYEKNGMAVYKRVYRGETAIIAINNTSKTQYVSLSPDQADPKGHELRGLLINEKAAGEEDGFTIVLDRDESEIYVLSQKLGLNYPFIAMIAGIWIFFICFFIFLARRGKKRRQAAKTE
ncbi:alpha-amylase family glycosyl hydrolase [Bacillus sp. FJAT-27245]|uniref:alpha-amylase family glycosyl hydrolase n=1 Tax=Bacillus sp. FJAT-27245 TaxID=1684144 RepID=UPI0006A7B555|nr:alpha-amylase family glycosyl hydrolase [Bacillus sp. FJAT-27245]